MIGKLETMEKDLSYLQSKFPVLIPLLKDSAKLNSAKGQDYHLYLKQLSKSQKSVVCELYKDDFAMFGYNCDMP